MDICTFWFGKELRFVDRLCLASMLLAGHHVRLYCYEAIENVPQGVEICDAHSILPLSVLYRLDKDFPSYKPQVSIVQLSDFFRIALMKHEKGFWLDTDVYLVKPLEIDKKKVWLAQENRDRVGVSALYLPLDNPIINAFDAYLAGSHIVPEWLGFKRRVIRPFLLRLKKQPITTTRLGTTIFGNDGISRLAKKFQFFNCAQPKETFYYWTGRKATRIFDPAYGLEPLESPDFLGFHIHRKNGTLEPALPGSFYEWALTRVAKKINF